MHRGVEAHFVWMWLQDAHRTASSIDFRKPELWFLRDVQFYR